MLQPSQNRRNGSSTSPAEIQASSKKLIQHETDSQSMQPAAGARCTVSKEQVSIYRTQLAGIGNRIRCEPSQSQSAKQERSTPSSYKRTLLQTIFDDVTEKRREGVPLSADIERESMNKETRT
ncbi:hypothetical protein KXV94_006618 [Aspergillus fumigatus]|nr:hypothetical protein KXV94_006618 [Aspergillus fumigatus]KAH2935605.1 hypothetical protein KXW15_004678 [Aspergillus fumigatus]KAH3205584.1 hypothetical protein KXW62_004386 [Aspergillus fumigatus]